MGEEEDHWAAAAGDGPPKHGEFYWHQVILWTVAVIVGVVLAIIFGEILVVPGILLIALAISGNVENLFAKPDDSDSDPGY